MFNPPPADLDGREPLIYTCSVDAIWYRSHRAGRPAIFFGKRRAHRWDAPDGGYGVLYLGADEYCAFMESIGRGVLRTRFVPASVVKVGQLSKVRFLRELHLMRIY